MGPQKIGACGLSVGTLRLGVHVGRRAAAEAAARAAAALGISLGPKPSQWGFPTPTSNRLDFQR